MDITCPKCKTEYEFEDEKITAEGVTVKCTSCDYTFKVRKKAVVEMEPMDFTPAARGAESKSWMIRATSGKVMKFKELTTLQQWIVERRVNRDDQISKSGETWKRLGDIAELASFFQVVEAAIAAESNAPRSPYSAGPVSDHSQPPPPPPTRDAHDGPMEMGNASVSEEPAFAATDGEQFKEVGPSAAWEGGGGRLREHHPTDDYLEDELPRRGPGKLIGIVIVLGVLLGAVVLGVLNKDKLMAMFTSDGEQSNETYQAGRKLFLLDDTGSLKQADLLFAKVKPESALVFAARAEVYTTWAQHLRERAEILERRARNLESTQVASSPVPKKSAAPQGPQQEEDVKGLRLKSSGFKDEADKMLIQAEAYAKKALSLDPERGEVKRAMADYLRLLGRKNQEIMPYIVETFKKLPDDPEAFYVEGAFYMAQGHLARAEKLFNKALIKTKARFGKTLLRASFQLAFLYLRSGRRDEAKALAQEILEVNANHRLARDLIVSIDEEEKVVAARVTQAKEDAEPAKAADGGKEPPTAPPPREDTPAPTALGYDALVKKGANLSERGQTMKAFKIFERALQLKPSGVEALTGIAYCHLDQEQFAMAIAKFKKALRVSPTNGDALIGMAESYKVQGNNNKSLDYYRAYLRSNPGGSRAVLARRNVKELERKTGAIPEPSPVPDPSPVPENDTPAPAPPAPAPPAPAPSDHSSVAPAALPPDVPEKEVPGVP